MENLGGRMRIMVSGGAPLSKTIAWFFRDAGITILEGYGMTETAATAVNLPHANVIGTVGPAVPGPACASPRTARSLVKGPGTCGSTLEEPRGHRRDHRRRRLAAHR